MQKKHSILIVEDEIAIQSGLVDVFIFHGYNVDTASDGSEGLRKALSGQYDMVLLDVMLPNINGFDICKKIRQNDKLQAIIMLTAKTSDEDIIQGLSLGADDYVAKPFSVTQLVLRVQAVLRRSKLEYSTTRYIQFSDGLNIDTESLSGERAQQNILFTRREMEIIQYLLVHNSRPISRQELLNKVWGYNKDLEIETRTVDIHIAKLRRKIEIDPKNPKYLTTIRGAGYRLLTDA